MSVSAPVESTPTDVLSPGAKKELERVVAREKQLKTYMMGALIFGILLPIVAVEAWLENRRCARQLANFPEIVRVGARYTTEQALVGDRELALVARYWSARQTFKYIAMAPILYYSLIAFVFVAIERRWL